jgi:CDGSH iron-sulfur domain-containing protein 3
MSDPVIADNKPTTVDLEAGEEYLWCACGRSSNQPFCDGSHAGTGITPTAFSPDESGGATLCKRTGNAPYCDGSHARFSNDQVGTAEPVSVQEVNPGGSFVIHRVGVNPTRASRSHHHLDPQPARMTRRPLHQATQPASATPVPRPRDSQRRPTIRPRLRRRPSPCFEPASSTASSTNTKVA